MKTKAQSHKMIVTVLVILISCFFVNTVNCNPQGNNTRKQQERAILVNSVDDERGFIFLKKKLHDQNDVIIYSVNQQGLADYGVSESMGQAMEYAALRKDRQYFDLLAAQTDKYYLDRAGYYYWKINAENYAGEQISALVDDLRIFKAYYLAAQNNMGDYSKQLAYVSESIYKFDSDGKYLYDFYDDRSQQKADYVSLFYLDMNSIDMLKAYDKQKWQELWQNSRELLQKIEKREYGFYPVAFSYSEKKYVWNETGINMVENLYTALNLYNADGDTGSLLKFMREEIKTNKKIARNRENVLITFLISLYDYDHASLQLDITKLIVLQPKREFPAKDKRKLLQILWSTIQMLYADDWSEVLNEVNRLGEWARANPEEFPVK